MNPSYYGLFVGFFMYMFTSCQGDSPSIEPFPVQEKVRSEIAEVVIRLPEHLDENLLKTAVIIDTTLVVYPLDCDTIKLAYQIATDHDKRYVEEVKLTSFEGIAVEMAALELFKKGNWTQIHLDYYNGEPIGCKRFFVFKNQLVAVEHIQLKEVISESGSRIEEQVTQVSYYAQDHLLETKYLTTAKERQSWQQEQKRDWQLIQQYL